METGRSGGAMPAGEIADTAFGELHQRGKSGTMLSSPWFTVYPDVGNLKTRRDRRAEAGYRPYRRYPHLKDTLPVTGDSPGQFHDVPFKKDALILSASSKRCMS